MALASEVQENPALAFRLNFPLAGASLAFLGLAPWFYGLTRFRDQLAAEVLVAGLLLTALPFRNWVRYLSPKRGGLDSWIFATLAMGAAYVGISVLPYKSLLAFLRLSSLLFFYGLVRSLVKTDRTLFGFLWATVVLGLFYSVYGLVQYYGLLPHAYWYQPISLASRYVNGGHFAGLLLFPLFAGIGLMASNRNLLLQAVLAGFLLVMGWALILTRSRAVWLAFTAGFALFLWLARRRGALDQKTTLGFSLLLLAGGFLLIMGGGAQQILARFNELGQSSMAVFDSKETRFYSLLYRWKLWQGALLAMAERPWGWGLGTFSAVFPQFRIHSDRFFVDYAHNEVLQIGVDLGIPGLLLLTGFVFFYFQRVPSFLADRRSDPGKKAVAAALAGLFLSLFLASQADFPIRIFATGFYFSTFLALSAYVFNHPAPEREERIFPARERSGGIGGKLMGAFLAIFLGLSAGNQLWAQIYLERGRALDKDFSWEKALEKYEAATHRAPFYDEYYDAVGSLLRKKAGISLNRKAKQELRETTVQAYEKAARLNPFKAFYPYSLGLLYEEQGKIERAKTEFLKAVSLESTNGLYISEYAYFALRHAMTEEVLSAFEKYKRIPYRETSPSIREDNFIAILHACYKLTQDYDQLRRVIPNNADGPFSLGHLLGEAGRWDLATKEFGLAFALSTAENPNAPLTGTIGDFYLSHGRLEEARKIFEEIAQRDPENSENQRKLAEVNDRLQSPATTPMTAPAG